MKTMKFLCTAVCVLLLSSCTNEAPTEELDSVEYIGRMDKVKEEDREKEEDANETYEIDLRQLFVTSKMARLEDENKKLEEKIEKGRTDLIPTLEFNLKHFRLLEDIFNNNKSIQCHFLGLKADKLVERTRQYGGDSEAAKELKAMDEVLRNCGIFVTYYDWSLDYTKFSRIASSIGKTRTSGGCDMPDRNGYGTCKIQLKGGVNKILVQEGLPILIRLFQNGILIAKAKRDEKSVIDGINSYLIDIPYQPTSKMSISVDTGEFAYDMPIDVYEGVDGF